MFDQEARLERLLTRHRDAHRRTFQLARGWAGVEAFTPDELPLLGPVGGIDGLLVAAGFSGHGFALAPALGDVLARLALGRPALEHAWAGLRADRVARLS